MYDNGLKSGAHKVMTVVFILAAIVMVVALIKVILDHVDVDGTVTSSKDVCENEENMSFLEQTGIFGGAKPRCKDSDNKKD